MLIRFVFWIVTAAVVVSIAGGMYQIHGTAKDIRKHPPPGEMVEVNGHRLHLLCEGEGSPTVLLEHAGGSSSMQWALVQPALAEDTRACSYDRAGFGWSDSSDDALDVQHAVDDLHQLLRASRLDGPIVLVGHSYGGNVVRLYAVQHPEQVLGVVLMDPGHFLDQPGVPDDVASKWEGQGAFIQNWGFVFARIGLFRAFGTSTGDLPDDAASAIRGFAASNKQWDAIKAQYSAFPASSEQLVLETRDLGAKPLIVLSATEPPGAERDAWTELNRDAARLSSNSDHRVVEGADHLGLATNRAPSAEVTRAIRDVIDAARAGSSVRE